MQAEPAHFCPPPPAPAAALRWLQKDWAKAELEARLHRALGSLSAGGLLPMAQTHLQTGGKRLRARLALCAGERLGLAPEGVWAWALACELMHNATLVHDDVQDGDRTRRNAPTVWARHGVAQAINVGDWLFMRAFYQIAQADALSQSTRAVLLAALIDALQTVIAGQTRECAFRGGPIVDTATYRQMVQEKTAALFVLPIAGLRHLGARPSEGPGDDAAGFAPVGELFQWADDVIDLYGDKGRDAVGQDLYEGKMSALVVEHVAKKTSEHAHWQAFLQAPRHSKSAADVAKASAAFVQSGALAAALAHIDALAERARAQCSLALRPVLESLLQAVMAPLQAPRAIADARRA